MISNWVIYKRFNLHYTGVKEIKIILKQKVQNCFDIYLKSPVLFIVLYVDT